jgi:hypothetical protein
MSEPLSEVEVVLDTLRTFDAGPGRVDRIRARCLATLAKRRERKQRRRLRFTGLWNRLEPAVALGLSAAYIVVAFGSSLALLR